MTKLDPHENNSNNWQKLNIYRENYLTNNYLRNILLNKELFSFYGSTEAFVLSKRSCSNVTIKYVSWLDIILLV